MTLLLITLIIAGAGCTDDPSNQDLGDDRDAFLGSWVVTENCAKDTYVITITKDPTNSAQVILNNFWHITNCSNPPYALIAGSQIVMPEQEICSNAFQVSGSGNLSKGKITMTYEVNDGADLFQCSAVMEHQ